ncbi:galactoside alpha-(1,2)-fucosyltransferase 2-like [Watersipora subatra]|uniref:galactoside alpha-(1,2)-fucosyltransferase 2-like n=1 Tax=Watersipora subatra TaxID=2589382 RepID=UPI00355C07C3
MNTSRLRFPALVSVFILWSVAFIRHQDWLSYKQGKVTPFSYKYFLRNSEDNSSIAATSTLDSILRVSWSDRKTKQRVGSGASKPPASRSTTTRDTSDGANRVVRGNTEYPVQSFISKTVSYSDNVSSSNSHLSFNVTSREVYPEDRKENVTRYLTINPLDGSVGRLGNFCFRYAAALGIALANDMQLVLPDTELVREMISVFRITAPLQSELNVSLNSFISIREKHWGIFDGNFFALPLNLNVSLTWVYSQSFKYFSSIEELVRREFSLTGYLEDKIQAYMSELRNNYKPSYIIGMHVRRGDFLTSSHQKWGYAVAPKQFFSQATSYFTKKYGKNVLFIVGSDDRSWCEQEIDFNGARAIFAPNKTAVEDFITLIACDHHIVSVGSFGWWSAWLGRGDVVYFKGFPIPHSNHAANHRHEDYYPPNWIGFY